MQFLKLLFRTTGGLLPPWATICCRRLPAAAQRVSRGSEIKVKFEAANPTLKADAHQCAGDEGRRNHGLSSPEPAVHPFADGTQIAPNKGVWTPLKGTYVVPTLSYLHERDHKRDLAPAERTGRHANLAVAA